MGSLALHQGPRSQAEYASILVTDATPADQHAGPGGTALPERRLRGHRLLDHRFDAGTDHAHACLAQWERTTAHRQPDEWTLARTARDAVRQRWSAPGCLPRPATRPWFSIDGEACLETSSFGYPGEGYYDAADVTALLQAEPGQSGKRHVVLSARVHWYGPGQGRAAGVPGLLAQLHVDYDDGRREVFATGTGWQVAEGPYRQSGYRNDEGDPVEHLDGTADPESSPPRGARRAGSRRRRSAGTRSRTSRPYFPGEPSWPGHPSPPPGC